MRKLRARAMAAVLLCATVGCKEHVTFLALEDLPVVEAPERLSAAPNRVVGTIEKGSLIRDAPVVRGMDYRYFEVMLGDGGTGYLRPSRQLQIYSEK